MLRLCVQGQVQTRGVVVVYNHHELTDSLVDAYILGAALFSINNALSLSSVDAESKCAVDLRTVGRHASPCIVLEEAVCAGRNAALRMHHTESRFCSPDRQFSFSIRTVKLDQISSDLVTVFVKTTRSH